MDRVGIEPPLAIEFGKELTKNGLKLDLENVREATSLSKEIFQIAYELIAPSASTKSFSYK